MDEHNCSSDGVAMIMPFIAVQSHGGPYEDKGFAAGWMCGVIDHVLQQRRHKEQRQLVQREMLDQLDLIAMRHGYVMEAEQSSEEWWEVKFTRVSTSLEEHVQEL